MGKIMKPFSLLKKLPKLPRKYGNKINIICTGTTYALLNQISQEMGNELSNIYILTDLNLK